MRLTGGMLVTTTYLEQTSPADLIPARVPERPCRIDRVDKVPPGPWPGAR